MRWRWVLLALGAIMRIAGSVGTGVVTRSEEVRRATTIADVLPAPVVAVAAEGVQFPVPAGVSIVTAADPVAERVGRYLTDLLGGSSPRPGDERPDRGVALLLDPAYDEEEYALEVADDGVTIRASGGAGLFWGVQTLRQLMPATGPIVLPGVRITDRPRFAYRGVMLDVARHFFDVATVKRLIDLTAMYKINHLHLHLSDDQGWRIVIDSWPRLATVGGSTAVGRDPGGYYTKAEYAEIVNYAAERFVTIVPEIDMPGHTNAALASYAELNCDGVAPPLYTGMRVGFSSLCVSLPLTYTFVGDVVRELAALTPGPYFHIGGDEASSTTPADYTTFVNRAQGIVAGQGKTVSGWHDVVNADELPSTVLQYWNTSGTNNAVAAAAARGTKIIMSPASKAYLDMKYQNSTKLGLKWAGLIEVQTAYEWDPATFLTGVGEASVLGVEGPLWSETLRTSADIEFMAFPRLPALMELAWSPRSTHSWTSFQQRLGAQGPRWRVMGMNYYQSRQITWPVGS